MKSVTILFSTVITIFFSACSQKETGNFILIKGGSFKNTKSNFYGKEVKIPDFYIGKYEVTQKEWREVMGNSPSQFQGENLPVEMVSWYECIDYCNKRSIKEGLKPCYNVDKEKKDPENTNEIDDLKWTVTINPEANGYRLPTEAEWEYASGGGRKSRSYSYSGDNDVEQVAWYWQNSGNTILTGYWNWLEIEKNQCKTHPVGSKKSNELGLFDMSGNVREWCWDWVESVDMNPQGRSWRGGGWIGGDFCCATSFRGNHEANGKGPDQGLRLCRSR